ncbi:hypothetical protein AMTRI_Chr02g265920 [Amborella trichopoda]
MLVQSPSSLSNTSMFSRASQRNHHLPFVCPNSLQKCLHFSWPRRELQLRASCYTRRPLGTAGAYELIDDETGEKFIVWGGVDNDESPIPSKEVLSWKPSGVQKSAKSSYESGEEFSTVASSSESTIHDSFSGSFSRLKASNVRALMKKSAQKKQGNTDIEGEIISENKSLKVEHVTRKTKLGLHRPDVSEPSLTNHQAVEGNEMVSEREINQYTKKSYSRVGYDNTKDRTRSLKSNEQAQVVSKQHDFIPRVDSSKGWNVMGYPMDNRGDLSKPLKGKKKDFGNGDFFSRKAFKDIGCSDDMIECLKGQLIVRPSHIQAISYAPIIEGQSCIIAEQSGSGKTLAYLAPLIQCLREEEIQGLSKSSSSSPRVVVLVPTAELASQVLNNCRSISKFGMPFRSMIATGGFKQKTQLDNLQEGVDVLIATPGRFLFLLQEGFLQLTNLVCAVLDEVDVLFGDEDFEQVLKRLMKTAPVTAQYLFVTATLPVDIYNKLVESFPDCKAIMGPGVHRTSSGLEEVLVDCSGDVEGEKTPETAFSNKRSALLQLVEETAVPKTIIFCNRIETCRKVENILNRFDRKGICVRALPFHAALTQESRLSNIKEFLTSRSEESMFLICTDRASRGIDFTKVDHVVLFDFPRDPSEYVRRVGRTARGAGGKGKAFVFVVGKQVSLARKIMDRNQKGHPLHTVPSAYELLGSVV